MLVDPITKRCRPAFFVLMRHVDNMGVVRFFWCNWLIGVVTYIIFITLNLCNVYNNKIVHMFIYIHCYCCYNNFCTSFNCTYLSRYFPRRKWFFVRNMFKISSGRLIVFSTFLWEAQQQSILSIMKSDHKLCHGIYKH